MITHISIWYFIYFNSNKFFYWSCVSDNIEQYHQSFCKYLPSNNVMLQFVTCVLLFIYVCKLNDICFTNSRWVATELLLLQTFKDALSDIE